MVKIFFIFFVTAVGAAGLVIGSSVAVAVAGVVVVALIAAEVVTGRRLGASEQNRVAALGAEVAAIKSELDTLRTAMTYRRQRGE